MTAPLHLNNELDNASWSQSLDRAISLRKHTMLLTPDDHPNKSMQLNDLGGLYMLLFNRLGRLDDLNKTIRYMEQAISLTPEGHPWKSKRMNRLGSSYHTLFGYSGRLEDLNMALKFTEQATSMTRDDHPDKAEQLNNLGILHMLSFKRLGGLSNLNKSIACREEAASLTSDNNPGGSIYLDNLSNSYQLRFERLGKLEDLHSGINHTVRAVLLTRNDHPDRPGRLCSLGTAYQSLFERLGRLEDIKRAIDYTQEAVSQTPDDHPDKPGQLNILGISYAQLSELLGRPEDLAQAVSCLEQAVSLTSDSHQSRLERLSNLGSAYHSLFKRTGRLEDLEKAVSSLEQVVSKTLDDHPDKPIRLSKLSNAYRSRSQRLGRLEELDKSISCSEQAVSLTPDGHPDKPGRLNGLGISYGYLFERLGRLDDLDKSVSCKELAVSLTPDNHPDKLLYLNSLGNAYQSLFERLGRLEDLNQAIVYLEQAESLTPGDYANKPACLNNLGIAYQSMFNHSNRLEDLRKSIDHKQRAVLLLPDSHFDKPTCMNNLGISYLSLFKKLGKLEDLNMAIDYTEQAVALIPNDHPSKPGWLINLAQSHFIKFEIVRPGMPQHDCDAIVHLQHAATNSAGGPSVKLRASHLWARHAEFFELYTLDAYTHAMTLLPQVVWLGTTVQDRYGYIASEVRDLVTAAAAAAIQSRQYSLAVEWLEQGRSIVWNQTQHLRTPLDDLRVAHPGLADQLQEICTRLEAASIPHKMDLTLNQNQSTPYEAAQVHRRSAENYDQLLESIRSLDGFEGFLRPIPSSILIKNLGNRTVVIINVHKTRCDALVVRPCSEDITSVSLTRFSVQKAKDAHAQLGECIQGAGNRRGIKYYHEEAKVTFTDILKMLWYDVAQPVLAHLNIAQVLPPNDDNLPHITWCTSGALSFLPLHAAGDYNSPSTVLSSLVISSYTPTLGVLGQSTLAHDPFSGILAVGHESTVNGLTALPGTRTELERVQQEIKGLPFTRLEGEHACVNTVLEAMENHNWIHFACHGSQNANDPMQSAFHLHDGDLDLAKIAQRSLKNAQLAFLSACETATGYATLPDESVHLAAGLLMAGYPTVIATMWSIHDEDAPLVAGRFYEHLLKGGPLDSGKAAKAFHTAVADLREQIGMDKYARWMPYVNIGR